MTQLYHTIVFIFLCFIMLLSIPCPADAVTITDDSGRVFDIQKPFQRIISLYAAHTKNLFLLGLDKKIIGASGDDLELSDMPRKPEFTYHDDSEKFMAARPDLVLIRPMIALRYGQFIRKLEQTGITVISLQPVTIEAMYDYWKVLGILTGTETQADEMVRRFQTAVHAIKERTRRISETQQKRVYFEAIHNRMKTFSPQSMAIFVLETAGGINVASDAVPVRGSNIAFYGKERILSKADKIEVYLAQYGVMNRVSVKQIIEESGFQVIRAIQNGQIYLIDETKVARPTPDLLKGICEIGTLLYPDVFKSLTLEYCNEKP